MVRLVLQPAAAAVSFVLALRVLGVVRTRHVELAGIGELDRRCSARRRRRLERALERRGLLTTAHSAGIVDRVLRRDPRAPVRVPVALSVGDSDDPGPLEDAMRRPVTPPPVRRDHRPPPRKPAPPLVVERSEVAQTHDAVRELLYDHEQRRAAWLARVPIWTMLLAALGILLTLGPLVRPLSDAAPWFALAGVACVVVAWFGARRRSD